MKNFISWNKENRRRRAQLDQTGRELVRAAAAPEEELEAAASAPFLYGRIRAAVAEKQRADAAARSFPFSMFAVMRHAVPLMVLTAFISLMLLFAGTTTFDETPIEERAANFDRVVVDEDDLPLSSDEVLSTIIAGHGDDDDAEEGPPR